MFFGILFGAMNDSRSTLVFGLALYIQLVHQQINCVTDLFDFITRKKHFFLEPVNYKKIIQEITQIILCY